MQKIYQIIKAIEFYWNASTLFRIHSPGFYHFCMRVLDTKKMYFDFGRIESFRRGLIRNNKKVQLVDYGAKGEVGKISERKISEIAKTSLSPAWQCRILFNLVQIYKPRQVFELGTCLGISASYLALSRAKTKVYTFEGNPGYASIAAQIFDRLKLRNVECSVGPFNVTLEKKLAEFSTIDLAFIDGNHTYAATINYFKLFLAKSHAKSILVFDDIYWSKEMTRAWEEIKKHPSVKGSLDIYYMGFIFFDPNFKEKLDYKYIPAKFKPWEKFIL